MGVLRQLPNHPVPAHKQVAALYAGSNKGFAGVPDARFPEAIQALYEALDNTEAGRAYTERFKAKPVMDDELKNLIDPLVRATLQPYRSH
jgi:F0F1-type ATP synthase alpha subunit